MARLVRRASKISLMLRALGGTSLFPRADGEAGEREGGRKAGRKMVERVEERGKLRELGEMREVELFLLHGTCSFEQ